ncbi:nuclear transport factor 2 family protein [Kribbella capetownensis]|uniref:Nuclear transport factor 2 family protein n=1 Tax=Kribbella capetownensis TaxID=1572659 RepID=A0A4R0JJP2_9ACTN|nr:nuclear transport factor 2 family protein [Kribbella capetownensis]TCC46819.1 nuclear transport factor 2 family protein [Kribbella capetownensis]
MTERDEFLDFVGTQLREAEVAIHNGDAGPRRAIWSVRDPVTVFGAWMTGTTATAAEEIFGRLEENFTDCSSYTFELISADLSGDVGYTIGYEHTSASWQGEPRQYTLRVTQLYRRESGAWKVFHRHADALEA